MKNPILFLVLFCVGTILSAQEKTWTLQESIQYAMEHNISVKQSQLDLQAAEIDKSDAIGNYLPTVNARATNSWNTGLTQNVTTGVLQNQTTRNLSAGVSVGITIFEGLRNLRTLQRAKMARLASEYSLQKMKDDIALFVANAYLEILVNKEILEVLQEQHQLTIQQLQRSQELVDAGVIPSGDLLQIKATLAEEAQQIIVAKNAVKISRINLAQTLLIENYKDFRIADQEYNLPLTDILNKPVSEIIEVAKKERYEVKIAQQNVELAKKDVEIAKSAYYPTLSGFFNYNTRESGAERILRGGIDPNEPTQVIGQVEETGQLVVAPNMTILSQPPLPFFEQLYLNDGISYGLSLNVPILNGFSTRNTVQRNKINVMRAEYELKQTKLDLESNVYQAYVDAEGAAESFEAAKAAVRAQQLAFNYTQERFDVGLANSFELSEAKFNLTNAQSELIQAKYDYIFNLKVLELYFGVPISELGL